MPMCGPHMFTSTVAILSNASIGGGLEPPAPSFEDAMLRLETIVEKMESGDVPLAELLSQYEEGSKLLRICEHRLKAAELKIEQLKRQKDDSLRLEPFAASERPAGS